MTADLPALLTRVEGGSGPDRELNADILHAFGWRASSSTDVLDPDGVRCWQVPDFIVSLDATRELAARFGFHLNLEPRFHIDGERVDHIARALRPRWADWRPDDEWFDRGEARHPEQVRAALAALLRALIDQIQEGKG